MNAARQLIEEARHRGASLAVRAGRIRIESEDPLPEVLLAELRAHKAELIALLSGPNRNPVPVPASARRRTLPVWDAEDWHALFHERTGILEHDHGLPRAEAEARAFKFCISAWMNRHLPEPSDPKQGCAHCGQSETSGAIVVPFGARNDGGATWLHHACWRAWFDVHRGRARAALEAIGICRVWIGRGP